MMRWYGAGGVGLAALVVALHGGAARPIASAFLFPHDPTSLARRGAPYAVLDDGETPEPGDGQTPQPGDGQTPQPGVAVTPTVTPAPREDEGDGSGDSGYSDQGLVNDGQHGDDVESSAALRRERTDRVMGGPNAFIAVSEDAAPVAEPGAAWVRGGLAGRSRLDAISAWGDRQGAALAAAAPSGNSVSVPTHVYDVTALNPQGIVQALFHPGDRVTLRVRWQVLTLAQGQQESVIWSVYDGRQTVYRHFRTAVAAIGRWRWTTMARIPRTAHPGVYVFEGKVVIGQRASWRIFTFRVQP